MDCNRALELDPKFDKALYRRALALENIGLKASAVKDLDRCLALTQSVAAQALKEKLVNERDAEIIEVECVEKGDEIRSDSDFVEIVIDIPQDVKDDHTMPECTSLATVEDDVTYHFGVPTTHRQFFKDFNELKLLAPEKFASYFLAIPSSNYCSLFGELLECEMISLLFRGLVRLLQTQKCLESQVSNCLFSLSEIPRFKLLVMFFGEDEKRDLNIVCGFMPYSDQVDIKKRFLLEESPED
ncbi:hypothetical protein KIN20_016948 [Parelaphostrongylus tenuis]|nr:hypothetical protein KIN20_016948 [Parelaphostrongylus tenuis]